MKGFFTSIGIATLLCAAMAFTSGCFTIPTQPLPAGGCGGGGCSVPVK